MANKNQFMEHRCGRRVALSAPATIKSVHRGVGVARVVEASMTGAFVVTGLKVPLLGRVSVRPLGAVNSNEKLHACVVRVEDRGVALEWLDPASDAVIGLVSLGKERQDNDRLDPAPQDTLHAAEL